jgi:hypothetical protein
MDDLYEILLDPIICHLRMQKVCVLMFADDSVVVTCICSVFKVKLAVVEALC